MQSRETSKDTLAQRSRYASEGCVSKTIVAADAVSQGPTDGRVRAVAEAYHVTLVAPFCLAAARSFFMHLGICSNVEARPRKVASSLSPNFNLPAQAGRRLKAFFCRERFARPRQARANLLEGRRNRPHCARRGRSAFGVAASREISSQCTIRETASGVAPRSSIQEQTAAQRVTSAGLLQPEEPINLIT